MEIQDKNKPIGIKGWLLLLCLCLTIIDPLSMAINLMIGSSLAKPFFHIHRHLFYLIFINGMFNIALITFSVYAGVLLWKQYKGAVATGKKYFIFLFFYSLIAQYLPDILGIPENIYKKIHDNSIFTTILNMAYAVAWYVYLSRSKRVKNTYSIEENR